ncbi:MAG TPA: BON domain-containing protein [Usitatibacter sp.]|nr:BON domain-containing protein [Usitatibacter sp.]
MRQESPSWRKAFLSFFPLALLWGCDRPLTRVAQPAPAAFREVSAPLPAPVAEPAPVTTPQSPSREQLTDSAITGRIKSAIQTDPGMKGADVSVSTDRGVVLLAGIVKTPEQTALASAHAQRQDGVMRVDNHLELPRT